MKDFINPYNDKMVTKIEGWITDLEFTKSDIIHNYKKWIEVLGDKKQAEHMTCKDLSFETCEHIIDLTYLNEYDRFYTIKQFYQMYHKAVENIVRNTIEKISD